MRVQAVAKNLRISPQKVRLVADQIRGQSVERAFDILEYDLQKGASMLRKVLDSAVANAETNLGADVDQLRVSEVYVNEGPRMKRFRARARGRGARIIKPMSQITLAVSDQLDDNE